MEMAPVKRVRSFDSLFQMDQSNQFLKHKTGAERMQIAFSINESLRSMLTNYLRCQNPGWDEEKIQTEVAKRFSYGNSQS